MLFFPGIQAYRPRSGVLPPPTGVPSDAVPFDPAIFTVTELIGCTHTPVLNWNDGGIEMTPTSDFGQLAFTIRSTSTFGAIFPSQPATLKLWAAYEWDVGTLMNNTAAIYAWVTVSSTQATTSRQLSLLGSSNALNWGENIRFRVTQSRAGSGAGMVGKMRILFFGYTL